ncbi:M28 family peptidase [Tahibacter aquaticus]|uniref:M28 family peptidase n=1 Tax=Tahibacter aquaticus TaxID=520092 RepID=UPI00105FAB04|nr:M28 family peptidase [Tahibacter aquaticus]
MRALPCALIALLTGSVSAAEITTIPDAAVKQAIALRDQALKDGQAYALLESLTTEVGPRLAGGVNDEKARNWAIAQFKQLGFDKVWSEPVTFPKWVRRSESASLVAPFPQPLAVTALGYSPATPKGGVTAPIVMFNSLDALKAAKRDDVKGKIVFVSARMKPHRDGHDYGIGSPIRSRGPAIAAELGAAAYVLRSAGTDSHRLPHTGVTQWKEGGPRIPAAAVSNPDADLIEAALRRGSVQLKLQLDCGIEGDYTGANVIGEITGSEKPDEVVIMGGHLDSWDLGTGAIDDGAGVSIGMAAGALIGHLPQAPRRSIRVVAFANEEAGLYGGKAYAAAHKQEVSKHVLGSESDFGSDRIWRLSASVKPESLPAIDKMMQVLAPLGVERGMGAGNGGPDLSPIHAEGMAALSLTNDGTRYFDYHHTADDTLDKVDPEQLAQNVAVYVSWAYMAAQADGDFGSAPGAFKQNGDDD